MQTVVGVRFKRAGKIYYFGPGDLDIQTNDDVIVETARGIEYGTAVIGPREVPDSDVVLPLKEVLRKATEADKNKVIDNAHKEREAFAICEEKIKAHGLPMKLVQVEYTFDVNKIIFYFTADGRIDFRELVKDLAAVFRTRIELRQIGVRDEAKLMGGIGCCGRPLCCNTFLGDFEPVSIRMAKEQNLSLNPTKISGICGRLMCCLKYENDCYCGNAQKRTKILPPTQGSKVITADGEGKVINLNQQRRTATILLDNSRTIVASWEDVIEKDEDDI
ncbi:stage 0 sporulation family protein [uncultured Anaerovibrio sp.]|uniref:PSP1 domain-containing protein n=1 Tax=uncultured Anaerovibrio sp. TaxID=361586 RepID=UPI002628485C|nr:stage 0 sporulation family protein [uncultured Anaerovibrio sp.]